MVLKSPVLAQSVVNPKVVSDFKEKGGPLSLSTRKVYLWQDWSKECCRSCKKMAIHVFPVGSPYRPVSQAR